MNEPQAAFFVRAVTGVVDEATRGSVMSKTRESLPRDLREFAAAADE